jgi:hypothetical protein
MTMLNRRSALMLMSGAAIAASHSICGRTPQKSCGMIFCRQGCLVP